LAAESALHQSGNVRQASRIPRAVYSFSRRIDTASLGLLDAGVITAAWFVATFAGFEGDLPTDIGSWPLLYLALPVSTQLVVNRISGLYGPIWKYASIEEATRVLIAVGSGAVLAVVELMIVTRVTDTTLPVFTMPPIAALLILLGCGGIRFQARLFALERQTSRRNGHVRTVIVGTERPGVALARELHAGGVNGHLKLVGFVGEAGLSRRSIHGLPVLGATADLEDICRDHAIERVLVALPDAGREETKPVVDLALKTRAQVKVLPRASELIEGPLVKGLRDIDLADLVGREHAPIDDVGIGGYVADATVLVTGAGGSIGSEIARQVAKYGPRKLVLLDRDDSLLCEAAASGVDDAELVLANICDKARIDGVFDQHGPDVVFHAAANKHVPILEAHPLEALQTNLLATWWLASTAARYGCRRFVHISTDKAVSPCSVMGATKRAAELVVFALGREQGLPCAVVRFGNVIGSRGSVVPTFLRQILDGGPITLTDPEMRRYFMSIPEAVSLVLQAGSMADGGKVFLLDMGEPAAIQDVARQMIRLAGLRPDEDIEIKVTGRRPGERLIERLHDEHEAVGPTSHPSIWSVTPTIDNEAAQVLESLRQLEHQCAETSESVAISLLEQLLRSNGVPCHLNLESTQKRTRRGHLTVVEEDVTVRRASSSDVPSVLALLQASLGWGYDERYAGFFAWKHEQNPFGSSPAWVAVDRDGQLLGFRTFLRWEFTRGASIVRAARAVDTATRPDAQRRGIFSRLTSTAIEALRKDGVAFVFNTPNQQSLPGYIRMGWQEVGRLPLDARAVSVDRWPRVVRSRCPAERWSLPSRGGVPAGDALEDRAPLERLLASVDRAKGLHTRLTVEFLRWRYGLPGLQYRVVTAGPTTEEGAAVFRLRQRGHAVEAVICDLLVPDGHQALRRELCRFVLAVSGADYAIRVGRPTRTGGFLGLPRQGPLLTWRALTENSMPPLRHWDLSLGDVELL
jgi:FlaA1/EpsC-like NDP-sugar epimerase/GNAT superfamily N-acetyltransferase